VPSARTIPAHRRAAALRAIAVTGVLALPFVLAFFAGGYFDEARLWGLLAASLVLAVAAVTGLQPLPRTRGGILAVAGLWALTGWTALSITWAPLRGPAFHDTQRLLLYAAWFTAAAALFRGRRIGRAIEPAVVCGCMVVLVYGLAGRLLPGLIHETHGARAGGRLDQPLTYWNAVGTISALALVLCARLAGDGERRPGARAAAAAACAPAGMALYLTYSRGALGAAAGGMLILLAAAPDRRQLRALVAALAAAVAAAGSAAIFPTVASLHEGSHAQGVAALVLLVLIACASAYVVTRMAAAEDGGALDSGPLRLRGLRPALAAAAVVVVAAFVVATASAEKTSASSNPAPGATATRLTSVRSHRYEYWKVALGAFADHPLIGIGSGGFGARWLEHRTINESVSDAHSLYIETAAELGVIGLLALAAFFAGIGICARDCLRADPVLAAGPIAGFVTWAIHAGVDWLWEMPAVSLIALGLGALLVAQAQSERPTQPA
jgi:hypothetical protein